MYSERGRAWVRKPPKTHVYIHVVELCVVLKFVPDIYSLHVFYLPGNSWVSTMDGWWPLQI